jgi:hypothetical protein
MAEQLVSTTGIARHGVPTIGTGLGNARFTNRRKDEDKDKEEKKDEKSKDRGKRAR